MIIVSVQASTLAPPRPSSDLGWREDSVNAERDGEILELLLIDTPIPLSFKTLRIPYVSIFTGGAV